MNDFSLRAFIANLEKYNEGELVGEWVDFPVSPDVMQGVLDRIGIGDNDPFGNIYDEIFITDMTTNVPHVSDIITAHENVEKLNYYAACVQALSEEEFAKYKAVLEEGKEIPEKGIDGLINLTFNLDRYDVIPAVRSADGISLRPMTETERMYCYSQGAQIESQTGLIGHLRGDMDFDGNGLFTSWTDHREDLKTNEFTLEFEKVINALRNDPAFEGILKNRSSLNRYGHNHPESAFTEDYFTDFGFRADTEKYSYFLRLNGRQGDYNLYCYAYYRPWLEQHMEKAKAGIRFITPDYEEKFRLPDGGRIRVTDAEGKTRETTCRYLDDYHMETAGGNIFHIAEYAERLQLLGITVEPISPVIEQSKQRKAVWKRIYDAELDSIPEEYRLPTAGLEELKEHVISAMEIAGYSFNEIETDYGCLRFNGEGGQVMFGGWKEAATWLDNAFVDDPELSDKVAAILRPDKQKEMTVLVVEPKKEPYVKTIPSGLESLQHEVGGDIEAVYPFEDPVALIVNEEGKLDGLPLNRGLYDNEGRLYDITSGTMLVVGLGEDNFASLSPELIEKYKAVYQQPEMFIRINKEMRVFPIIKEGKENADMIAADTVQLFSDSGFEGYFNASPSQLSQTQEAFSIMIRSGEDYSLRRNLIEISESDSDCSADASTLLKKLDDFYTQQKTPRYSLYQVNFEGENVRDFAFRPYDELQKDNLSVDAVNYSCVYSGRLEEGQSLDNIYERFNLHRPLDFLGHSLSVSDVIVVHKDGNEQAYYVDSFGFKEVPEFCRHNQQETHVDRADTSRDSDSRRTSVLSRLEEKKDEAAKINQKRQKPEKVKGLDR
jgi:hypothetical protein